MAGTIQGEFGWSNAPVIAGMREAETVVTRGARNIETKIAGLFKRDPTQRAERAIGGFVERVAGGDLLGGIQGLTGAMSGFGLAAGVAIGAGVAAFIKLKERIDETKKASEALAAVMSGPLARTAKLAPEEIGARVAAQKKSTEELIAKSQASGTGFLSNAWSALSEFEFSGQERKPQTGKSAEDQEIQGALEKQREELTAQTAQAERLLAIKERILAGDQHGAALQQIIYKTERERAQLAESAKTTGLSAEEFQKQDALIRAGAEAETAAERKREQSRILEKQYLSPAEAKRQEIEEKQVASKERSLAIEEKMQSLIKGGLAGEEQGKVRAGLELKNIEAQLATETDPMKSRELSVLKSQKENELRAFGKPGEGEENPYGFGTISARDWERQQESAKFNDQFASFGLNQQQRDAKGPAAQTADVAKEVHIITELIRQIFLKP